MTCLKVPRGERPKVIVALRHILFSLALLCAGSAAQAAPFLTIDEFLQQNFSAKPALKTLWLNAERKQTAQKLFDYQLPALRLRYWEGEGRTAWMLDEIGKEMPITIGVVVEQGHIKQLRVLEFRESRGWEVRHNFFADQYNGSRLTTQHTIDKTVDGITGATLSVRAVNKVARMALWLDQQVRDDAAQTH